MVEGGRVAFVHLHTHSEYSPLDSIARMPDLVQASANAGFTALAVTDHGTMSGLWSLRQEAAKHGIKPILGIEAYLAIGSRLEKNTIDVPRDDLDADAGSDENAKSDTKKKKYEHIVLLARNKAGWRNLLRIHNDSQQYRLGKQYPRVDYDLIGQFSEGIIILTGCIGGPVLGPMSRGDRDTAARNLDRMIDAVGHENVYVEIMEHGIAAEAAILPDVVELARSKGVRIVATNDSHYVHPDDAHAQELWLAKGRRTTVKDPKRWKFHGTGYHLRTEAEMRALRTEDWWQEACDETARVADRIEADVMPEPYLRLPKFEVPGDFLKENGLENLLPSDNDDDETANEKRRARSFRYFVHLVKEGAWKLYGNPYPDNVRARLNRETGVIRRQGLVDYFLIVHEMIAWARERGIAVGPGRGSAAGSAIAYCLGLVQIDPIANDLLFERFLDPQRIGMPDIDSDFEAARRDEVIRHLRERYGEEMVARIGTFQVSKTKAAIKNACQVLARPSAVGDALSKSVPVEGVQGYSFTKLDATRKSESKDFWHLIDSDPANSEVIELARRFEDVVAGQSVHPCGIIISDQPLTDLIPMRTDTGPKATPDDPLVSEWDGGALEKGVGLLKLDVLGIRNLDIVSGAMRTINRLTGRSLTMATVPDPNDYANPEVRAAYDLIAAGETEAVFQLESSGMRELARSVAPTSLEHLGALVALYRPGPLGADMHRHYAERKTGQEDVDYGIFTDDPAEQMEIAKALGSTYGLTVYQEQAMILGRDIAGFGVGLVNRLRKAISKKLKAEFPELGREFVDGAMRDHTEDGAPKLAFQRKTAERLWHTIEGAAAYAFNKSHSTAYGYLAFVTAWLKALHPAAYGAAVLSLTSNADKRAAVLASLRREGIEVLTPDINRAHADTTALNESQVILGLSEIRDVGDVARLIVDERGKNGDFTSLSDLLSRMDGYRDNVDGKERSAAPVKAFAALIESGACDTFGPREGQTRVVRAVRAHGDIATPHYEWGVVERAIRQHLRLGCITDRHPVEVLWSQVGSWQPHTVDDYGFPVSAPSTPLFQAVESTAQRINVVGLITSWSQTTGKYGTNVSLTLEDAHTSISAKIWSSALRNTPKDIGVGSVVGAIITVKLRTVQREVEEVDESGEIVTVVREETFKNYGVESLETLPYHDLEVASPAGGGGIAWLKDALFSRGRDDRPVLTSIPGFGPEQDNIEPVTEPDDLDDFESTPTPAEPAKQPVSVADAIPASECLGVLFIEESAPRRMALRKANLPKSFSDDSLPLEIDIHDRLRVLRVWSCDHNSFVIVAIHLDCETPSEADVFKTLTRGQFVSHAQYANGGTPVSENCDVWVLPDEDTGYTQQSE